MAQAARAEERAVPVSGGRAGPSLAAAAAHDHELQSALRVLQRSRAEALDELKVSQDRARGASLPPGGTRRISSCWVSLSA